MTKIFTKTLTLSLFLLVFASSQKAFSQCFQIESILVAACSPPPPAPTTEGYNEMVRFRVGSAPLNTSTLNVNWPSNSWQGLVQNATTTAKVATLNAAIDAAGGCGDLLQPVGGVLPANAPVILVTSYQMDTNSNSFGALAENTYIIFQNNPSTTGGHFANYNPSPGMRTLTMSFGGGCSDTVTYDRTQLSNAIGATVLFTPAGAATYVNYGCSAPVPPFTVDAGTTPISACAGTTVALLGTAEGHQSVAWSAPSGTFSAANSLSTNYTVPAGAAGQTITITLTATNSCGTSITDTVTLNVTASTAPTFNLPTTLCNGATAPALPTTSTNGVTGTWSPAAISNTADGSYVFTPNAGQCSAPFTLNVAIQNGSPTVTGFSYTTPVCSNSGPITPTTATGFTSGGTYASNLPGLSLNTSTGEINVAASTPGSYIVEYEILASGCQSAGLSSAPIEIKPVITPGVNFSYPATICKGSTSVVIIPGPGFTPGGTFSSDSGLSINPATGEVNPSASTPNPHSVIYTFPADPANCVLPNAFPALITFTAETAPAVTFSYPAQVCATSGPVSPTTTPGTSGGAFTATTGLVINPSTGVVNVAASTAGLHTIIYTVVADPAICRGGDSFSVSFEITNGGPAITGFSYTTPICADNGPIMPNPVPGFTSGGTYASNLPGLSLNTSTGEINVAASTPGLYSVTYTVLASGCQGGGSDTAPIEIKNVIAPAVTFSYPAQACSTSAPVSPTSFPGTTGGTFTGTTGLVINPSTGVVNVTASTVGTHTITYTVAADPTTCQAGDSFSVPFEITNAITPVTGFSYTTPVCITSTTPLFPNPFPGFVPGGVFSGTPGLSINTASGEINIAASTAGLHSVTYTVAPDPATCNAGGVSNPVSITINNLATPVVSFGYTNPVCPDSAPVNPNLFTGFTWGGVFSSDPGLSINPNTGQVNVAASTAGPHTVTYTLLQNDATCTAGGTDTAQFIIDAGSALPPITGGTSLCAGETLQLANATPGGTWSSSDPSIATVDNNGLVTGIISNFVDIIYTVNTGCSTTVRTTLAVYSVPQPVLQDRYLCLNNETGLPYNSVRLECGVPNVGFTFVWTLNGNPLLTTTNTHVATEVGLYEVTVTSTVSGCSNTASCNVLASSAAIATATVGEDFNLNQTITVNVTGGSGDYLFQLDHGIPQESNVFTYVHQGEYTITVIDKNGCQDLELVVFALNYPRFFTPNGDGFNDTWGIRGLTDLKAKTYIFDRYGKLVKYLNASGEEWDGTLNGHPLPSTDYWFLLEYKNRDGVDKEFKAHFSMKR